MTVEENTVTEAFVDDVVVVAEAKVDDVVVVAESSEGNKEVVEETVIEKSSSFKEESNVRSDLKENEKKALSELKLKVEEAILGNKIYKKVEEKEAIKEEKVEEKEASPVEGKVEGGNEKEKSSLNVEEKEKLVEGKVEEGDEKEKFSSKVEEKDKPVEGKVEEGEEKEKSSIKEKGKGKLAEGDVEKDRSSTKVEEKEKPIEGGEEKGKSPIKVEEKEKSVEGGEEKEKSPTKIEEKENPIEEIIEVVDKDISLWGVPLLPSKGADCTDVILLKFLRAREFKVNEAYEMLINTLRWRKDFNIESPVDNELAAELSSVAYMDGVDRNGHPICYNICGVFDSEELYQKVFGTEEKRQNFLRWRLQLMEKGIEKLDLKPEGISSLLQINDLKNSPGPSKKEFRSATKQAVALLQDNYPEFVARDIFINVPFWYYAFNAVLSPFFTMRTKSKFVFARPGKVTDTLLKYVPAEEIPIRYGGLKREKDYEFSVEDGSVIELFVKSGSTETIEIPVPEVGTTILWDLTVVGWEVNYKEEFVPNDDASYTIIVQKGKKKGANEEPIRNSYKSKEPGKIVLTIDNPAYKKKRVFYRYKTKTSSS
ncbi:hypothetical protein GIB67_023875 [Kingdonia uniflora]|uniref:Patellin-4 n=1 Tax=Kingdonia uniflora TaxID=39325 RepID=A0A7J7NG53_9MAGN|nr:hypothetical protein GIB67_023875 [Kingdonia uniflora]